MACIQAVRIKLCTYDGNPLGHTVAYAIINSVARAMIPEQGALAAGCQPEIGRGLTAVVDYLDAPPVQPNTVGKTLLIRNILSDNTTTEDTTMTTMLANTYTITHQGYTPRRFSQSFDYIGDWATEPGPFTMG